MAVTEQTPVNSYTANGVTTVFAYSFLTLAAADLVVLVDGLTKTLGVDYTVAGLGAGSGGSVTFLAAPANGLPITIYRDSAIERVTDYQDNGDLLAETLNADIDRQVLILQEIFNGAKGAPTSLRVAGGETIPSLPRAAQRANTMLLFDADGNPYVAAPASGTATDLALNLASSAAGKGAEMVGFKADSTSSQPRSAALKLREWLSIEDLGASGIGGDDSLAFDRATVDAQNRELFIPQGICGITRPFRLPTGCKLRGVGIGSQIKALSTLGTPPSIAAGIYTPTLSFSPMVYNSGTVQWFDISGVWLNGDNRDVYGLWLMENFYGGLSNVLISATNKRPYTNIRGQVVTHRDVTFYGCADGVLSYDNTALAFYGCGFERLGGAWFYDQRQPNSFSKGGVQLDECWFESDPTNFPTAGFLRLSGRRNWANFHAAFHTTATTEEVLRLNDTTDSRTIDGIVMGASACTGADILVNNATGNMLSRAMAGALGNSVRGNFTANKVTDSGAANTWDVTPSLATPVRHVTGRYQVRNGDSGSGIPTGATNYALDVDPAANEIRMLSSTGHKFGLNGAKLALSSNAGLDLNAGGTGAITLTAQQFLMLSTTGGFTPPQMTTAQRDAISSPQNGLIIFNTTTGKHQARSAGAWVDFY